MAEFTPIESQEQLDAVLKERLSRAQAKHQKEIEELTAKYSGHDEMAAELESFRTKVADLEKSNKEKDEKLTAYERASVKTELRKSSTWIRSSQTDSQAKLKKSSVRMPRL